RAHESPILARRLATIRDAVSNWSCGETSGRASCESHDVVLHGLLCVFEPCRRTRDLVGELIVVDGDRRLAYQRSQELHFFAGQSVSLGCVEGEDAKNLFLRDQWHAKVGDEAVSSVEVLVLYAGIGLDIGDQKRRVALEDHLGETPSRPPAIHAPVRLVDIPGAEILQRPGCDVEELD